jgi:hypothetical protein
MEKTTETLKQASSSDGGLAFCVKRLVKCFDRYLRAQEKYPLQSWPHETVVEYDEDRQVMTEVYERLSKETGFGEAAREAKRALFLKLILAI